MTGDHDYAISVLQDRARMAREWADVYRIQSVTTLAGDCDAKADNCIAAMHVLREAADNAARGTTA